MVVIGGIQLEWIAATCQSGKFHANQIEMKMTINMLPVFAISHMGFIIVIELSLENEGVRAEGRRVHGVFYKGGEVEKEGLGGCLLYSQVLDNGMQH